MFHLSYLIGDEPLCCTTAEKDLGVVVDQNLKFHQNATSVATKANRILVYKNFEIDSLPILCKTLACPILEYVNSV